MIELLEDRTIYMNEVQKLIGSESAVAERVRKHRENRKLLHCNADETNGNTEIDIEIDTDKEIQKDKEIQSLPPAARASAKPTRHKYGQYKNVLLSDEDMDKLKAEFPSDWEQRIERLSEYIESKGAKYKNHLATIRSWARKEKKPDAKHVGSNTGTDATPERGIGWNRVL